MGRTAELRRRRREGTARQQQPTDPLRRIQNGTLLDRRQGAGRMIRPAPGPAHHQTPGAARPAELREGVEQRRGEQRVGREQQQPLAAGVVCREAQQITEAGLITAGGADLGPEGAKRIGMKVAFTSQKMRQSLGRPAGAGLSQMWGSIETSTDREQPPGWENAGSILMPEAPLSPRPDDGKLRRFGRGTGALALVAALVLGIQLGAIPWRYRKQIWQLQGALVGLVAGFVLGRLSGGTEPPPG